MIRSIGRRAMLGTGMGMGLAAGIAAPRRAGAADAPIRIGVLTDMSGAYMDNTGPGSVIGAKLAIEDYRKIDPSIQVELISADELNKPDVALGIAGDWYGNQGVDLILDLPLSSAALGLATMAKERNKVAILTGAGTADLTGKACGPNHLHWVYDTWSLPAAVAHALVAEGADTWYFITADYAYGHSLQRDTAGHVLAAGGKVLGESVTPFPGTTDFSSYLIAARASGAKVVGLANGGGDAINCIKQAAEFGFAKSGIKLAGLVFQIADVHALGLEVAQGVLLTEPFYWDLNDGTRAFGARVGAQLRGQMPSMDSAGCYSAVTHYLKVVSKLGVAKAKADGRATIEQMKAMPTDDPLFGKGRIREDGRKIHDMYLFQVKAPAESKSAWDLYKLIRTIPAEQAFRPLSEGGCPMVKA
jgi:branched-chain amino acid transport system substrate-binding protein